MQRQDLEIVDCLLPPGRQVGGRTFSTPRRRRTTETNAACAAANG
jgi:hypothetical protein